MILADELMGMLSYLLGRPGTSPEDKIAEALRLLCKYRSEELAAKLLAESPTVRAGPFAGMTLLGEVAEGAFVPKLLGCYEQELQSVLQDLSSRDYRRVINIGCAEGFYAVGLARLLPDARVDAFDIDDRARELCRLAAERNGVDDRLSVDAEFRTDRFQAYRGEATLVVCDIEGAEFELLQLKAAPYLARMDLLVEVHEEPGTGHERLQDRFASTHEATVILPTGPRAVPPQLGTWDNLDRLLAVWEWRLAGNHWLWLQSRELG